MAKFVRSSKFRHIYAPTPKLEQSYVGVKIANTAWDTNFIAANTKYFAMLWQSGGGGVFAVIPHDQQGKLGEVPLVSGHKASVLDIDWNPFNDSLIASCSEDCNVNIWGIPEGGLKENLTSPLQTLTGHKRKVGTVNFHPCANNILATSSADYSVKIWDIEKGDDLFSTSGHTDLVQSCSWNNNGSLLASSCKDKKLRIIDPRASSIVAEAHAHNGGKGFRTLWLTDKDKILTCGFSRSSEREFNIWDPRDLSNYLSHQVVDSMSGMLMPFYDTENSILYLAGKGDGNIRYYELVDEKPFYYYLNQYTSSSPQKGCCLLPKRAVNTSKCEIARMLKLTADRVEPISFIVPRKSEVFQDDIYPKCFAGVPTLTADEWKNGANQDPDMSFNHEEGFVPVVKNQEFKPVVKEVEKPKTEKEIREENEQMKNRISYLEAEITKRDARIKELEESSQ